MVKKTIDFVMDGLESFVFVGSLFIILYIFIAFPTEVKGISMEPNFHTGDRVIISKINYKIGKINRGDVVVLKSPNNSEIDYFKRVIGIPGDKIMIKDGKVYLNDQLLKEDYINVETNTWENGYVKEGVVVTIPNDEVFVMGDNRPRSLDSREFGPVPINSIDGKAIYRYYPPDKANLIKN
jgi:signal peptidase I